MLKLKVCQHRVIINKIKCAKSQIFSKMPTWSLLELKIKCKIFLFKETYIIWSEIYADLNGMFCFGTFIVVIGKNKNRHKFIKILSKKLFVLYQYSHLLRSGNWLCQKSHKQFSCNKLLLHLIEFSTLLNDQQKLLYYNYGW